MSSEFDAATIFKIERRIWSKHVTLKMWSLFTNLQNFTFHKFIILKFTALQNKLDQNFKFLSV